MTDVEILHSHLKAERLAQAVEIGRGMIEEVIGALHDEREVVRITAIRTLGALGDDRGVSALIEFLDDKTNELAARAVTALGDAGSQEGVECLIACLRVAGLQQTAAYSLGKIGTPQAVPSLLDLLNSPSSYVRNAAATALGQIGDDRARDRLATTLEDDDFDVRKCAALALAKYGDLRAIGPLREIYADKRVGYSQAVVGAALRELDVAAAAAATRHAASAQRCMHHYTLHRRQGEAPCDKCRQVVTDELARMCQKCGIVVHTYCAT